MAKNPPDKFRFELVPVEGSLGFEFLQRIRLYDSKELIIGRNELTGLITEKDSDVVSASFARKFVHA